MFVWLKRIGKIVLALVIVGLFVAVMFFLFWSQGSAGKTRITFLNGTQDGNVLIQTPFGHTVVIQTTSDANISAALSSALPFYQRHIDLLILSELQINADEKTLQLFDQYDISLVALPTGLPASAFAKTIQQTIQSKKIPFELVDHAKIYEFVGNQEDHLPPVNIQLLYPPQWTSTFLPVRVLFGDTSAFITGPVSAGEQQMLRAAFADWTPSDLLVSPKSTILDTNFLKATVKPQGIRFDSRTLEKNVIFELSGTEVVKKGGI